MPKLSNSSKQIGIEDVKNAYRKLKHFYYNDNLNLLYRKAIAEFEYEEFFEIRLEQLTLSINRFLKRGGADKHLKTLLGEIKYNVLPKKIKPPEKPNNGSNKSFFYSNTSFQEEIIIEKVTYFINAPVEVHIISVLWIMEEGFRLEEDSVNLYGNRLQLKNSKQGIADGLNLFKPYFVNYQKWRDTAINKAKELVTNNTSVALIGLDIKSYYDSVELDFPDINSIVNKKDSKKSFTMLLQKVHDQYFEIRKSENQKGLPIGLLSSSVIANWYLEKFDSSIRKSLRPIYYGRYVDDILIVLSNPDHEKEKAVEFKEALFRKYFIDTGLLEKKSNSNEYKLVDYPLSIQESKVSLMYFQANEPLTLLNQFQEELKKNSSEFRFLPIAALDTFEASAHSVNYTGSKSKLRSISDFTSDKFGASRYLAKKIYAVTQADQVNDKETAKQLLTYFKKERAIEFYSVWEKVFTYFILVDNRKAIFRFLDNFDSSLQKMECDDSLKLEKDKIKDSLQDYAHTALSMALGLQGFALGKPRIYGRKGKYFKGIIDSAHEFTLAKALRKSNMLRHNYISYSLLNYTHSATEGKVNLIDKNAFLL